MNNWNTDELRIIEQAKGKEYKTVLKEIPVNDRKWKCHTCFLILKNSELIDNKCPICGEVHVVQMCPLDHNGCGHDIVTTIVICPICSQPLCPVCGCHDVLALSRITGYIQDLSGFNNAKKQEVIDRTRYVVA